MTNPEQPMVTPEPNLGLIGAGYWGKNLARNFNALGVLHSICDASQSILDGYQAEYAAVAKITRAEGILQNPAISRVAVAAPATRHYELVKAALTAGKDVFVEKPLCLDARQGEEQVELAEKKGLVLMVGHLLQYHPCVQKLQSLLAEGELGKLHYMTSNRLNLGKIRREENALWSFAPHDISVILSLAGNQVPESISCTGEAYLTDGVADTTLTAMRFAGGVRAHIFVSWLNPFKEQKLTVVGSNGMAVFDDTRPWNEKLLLYRHYLTWTNGQIPTPNKAKGEFVVVAESEPLRNECAHFLECCQNRRPPRTDGREGLRVLRVLQMAQSSLDSSNGEAVTLSAQSQGPRSEGGGHGAEGKSQTAEIRGQRSGDTSSVLSDQKDYFVHSTAVVDEGAIIGKGTKIWHFCHLMKGAKIGERCVFGQNVNVDGGTVIGNNVKVQNNVSIYTGLVIEDDVFLGPSCVLTNVTNPRSQVLRHSLYEKTVIRRGATVGANATIVCGITLGRYCFIAAGSVVTKDVPDYALVMGNPGRQKGWMSRHGHILKNPDKDGIMVCSEWGLRYRLEKNVAEGQSATASYRLPSETLRCVDLDEESALPSELSYGTKTYDDLKLHGRTNDAVRVGSACNPLQ